MTFSQDNTPNLQEVRALLAKIEPARHISCAGRDVAAALPVSFDGRNVLEWLSGWQSGGEPALSHPRVAIFASTQGCAAGREMDVILNVRAVIEATSPLYHLGTVCDADLRVYEMLPEQPTNDFRDEPAMSDADCAHGCAYGMMAVEQDMSALCLGAFSNGTDMMAEVMAVALFESDEDAFDVLARYGGRETAAMVGAILAARLAKMPVFISGLNGLVAMAVLFKAQPEAIDHCLLCDAPDSDVARLFRHKMDVVPLMNLASADLEPLGAMLGLQMLQTLLATTEAFAAEKAA